MKKIAVLGATGAQGGGLIRAILKDSEGFTARAVVRDRNSEKALALAAKGVEVVEANFDDVASLEKTFAGVYGAFCVTNFAELMSAEKEVEQAANMAEAAKQAGVKHVIWSTLEDPLELVPLADDRIPSIMGNHKLPHAEGKANGNKEFIKRGVPTTFMITSFFWDNFVRYGMGPAKGPDGTLTLTMPMGNAKLPGIAVEDVGKCAFGIFKKGSQYIGKTVGIAGEHLTGQEMADAYSKALGQTVNYYAMPIDDFRNLGFPGVDIAANTYHFYQEFSDRYCDLRPVSEARLLNPELQSFDDWLEENKNLINAQA
ncbi:NmrA/HSCARG family protein [Pantoea agglomerans]|uniref:NmrA/HSCARG family protein n=1 Tax=Enterobacter agglomerans TaxID=549 RepID=UPI001877A3DC|nr:NmrA/HSCARG family protein [Pantoea agglomerans]MBE5681847.1 NmrA/HSCARG family protein [Pantoea agglomerans]